MKMLRPARKLKDIPSWDLESMWKTFWREVHHGYPMVYDLKLNKVCIEKKYKVPRRAPESVEEAAQAVMDHMMTPRPIPPYPVKP